MFRFSSMALASVVALGCTLATPSFSRADFGLGLNVGRSYIEIGTGPRVIAAPAPVVYPAPAAPVVVDYAYRPIVPRPVVVVPEYYPWVGYRGPVVIPHHYHHDHHHPRPY
jgi:hypothetical protein